jgi:hypothetical protein
MSSKHYVVYVHARDGRVGLYMTDHASTAARLVGNMGNLDHIVRVEVVNAKLTIPLFSTIPVDLDV